MDSDSPAELLIRSAFCIPASTFQRLQDTAATNGWRIGHVVEHAIELYLREPTPPAIRLVALSGGRGGRTLTGLFIS